MGVATVTRIQEAKDWKDGAHGSRLSQLTFLLDPKTLFVDQNIQPQLTSAGSSQVTEEQARLWGANP